MSRGRQEPVFSRIQFPSGLRWMVVVWLVAEAIVFLLLVKAIGLGGTIVLGLGTTVLGIALLRRIGLGAMQGLRRAAAGQPAGGALPDGLLSAFGALLLIVPGFLANAAGLALMAPSTRRALVRRFGPDEGAARGRGRTDVIDLGPGDWTPVDRA